VAIDFAFRTAPEILFGAGKLDEAPAVAARFGRRCLLVTGQHSLARSGRLAALSEKLQARGLSVERWSVDREPDVPLVDEGARLAREGAYDVVLAVGGGSVIDGAKAVAALATNEGPAIDYVEAVGAGKPIARPPLPLIAVPTTAGSGSEVTKNSVVRVPELRVKRSIRSDLMVPRAAILDPALIATAPRSVAASSGLDALTHLIEAFLSKGAQPMTDVLVVPGMRMAFRALTALAEGRADAESHEAMALASLWGGIALANAGLGAVHGLVAPLGGRCEVPHGAGCGCLLPATFATNVAALRQRAPGSRALARATEVADLIMPEDEADRSPERAAAALDRLRERLGVPALGTYGVEEGEIAAIIAGSRAGSMRYNPIELTDEELSGILRAAMAQPGGAGRAAL
jgi:alcohol dehydrogenase class IV